MKICCLCLVFSALLVQPSRAESLDERLYREIHDRWQSPSMDRVMSGVSEIGDREVCLSLCLGLTAFGNEKGRRVGKLSTVSLVGGQAVCSILKAAVNRNRPEGESDRMNSSFPSGHAAGAFSLAYVVAKEHPGLTVPSYMLAGLVSISRVYLGRHYPSDVLAGAVIGCAAGYLVMTKQEAILNFHL